MRFVRTPIAWLFYVGAFAGACSTSDSSPAPGSARTTSATTTSGAAGSAQATTGATTGGGDGESEGSGAGGRTAAASSSAGTATSGGAAGLSGTAGGQGGNGAGQAGNGGGSGNGGAGAGGGGDGTKDSGVDAAGGRGDSGNPGTTDDLQAAAVLDRYALLKPCKPGFALSPNPNGDCCCEETAAEENQHKTIKFGGDPNITYNVKLHVRGVAERYWYEGGMLDGMLFYRGGLPTIHSAATATKNGNLKPGEGACKVHPPETDNLYALPFKVPVEVNPADGCFNGFNIFAMVVTSPKKTYYLNYTTDFDGSDRQPHKVYKTDYTVTVSIQGESQIDFYTIDGDHHQVTNDGTMSVPGVKLTQPYNGNFLEFAVEGVTRAAN